MSEIEEKSPDRIKAENEGLCYEIALDEGLITRAHTIEEIHFVSRMAKHMFEEDHFPVIHSWNDDYYYGCVSGSEIFERTIGRMRLNGFLLKDEGVIENPAIHVWADDDTVAFALAAEGDNYDIALYTVAFTDSRGHHIDLVNRNILQFIDYEKVLHDGEILAGFRSYYIHKLDTFLTAVGVTALIDKNGKFISNSTRYPDLDGAEVLEATEEGFEVLQMISDQY